jgi:predicted NAD/FAD-dependent oxidoreductase
MIDVAIIGAGIAGLTCARRLAQAGLQPVLFDKGCGIGGRVATRRTVGLQFDHGAQYVTARSDGFAALLRDLATTGAAAPWSDGSRRTRIVGTPGMSSLAKGMGLGLDIRQSAPVTAIHPTSSGRLLRIAGAEHRAARVVVTVPAPQVACLLGADHQLVAALAGVRFAPCLTLMAAVAAPAPFVTRDEPDDRIAWIAQDSSKPGRPAGDTVAWVAQAGPEFSAQHLEDNPTAIAALMLPLLCERLGVTPDRVTHVAAHRWRYARVTAPLGQPFLRDPDATLYLGGDWCVGPRVEAAWISGMAIADDLLRQAP